MNRTAIISACIITILVVCDSCGADPVMPSAPASLSWLPHGYGATMRIDDPARVHLGALHGFRLSPAYVGCWSEPVWGWDVNSSIVCRPPVYPVDPGKYQLPLGFVYSNRGR